MSDLTARMNATLQLDIIAPGSSAGDYDVAQGQFREALTDLTAANDRADGYLRGAKAHDNRQKREVDDLVTALADRDEKIERLKKMWTFVESIEQSSAQDKYWVWKRKQDEIGAYQTKLKAEAAEATRKEPTPK